MRTLSGAGSGELDGVRGAGRADALRTGRPELTGSGTAADLERQQSQAGALMEAAKRDAFRAWSSQRQQDDWLGRLEAAAADYTQYRALYDALPSGSDIIVGKTPTILQQYGAPDVNLHISQNTVRKIAYPNGYYGGKHNLGISAVKNLPYQIADPLAILKSRSQPDSLIVVTEWHTADGQNVIIPLHLRKRGAVEVLNSIASAYGTSHIDTILGENNGNVLYTKNNEDIHQLLSSGLQLPEAMADDVLARETIPQTEGDVKRESGEAGSPENTVQNAPRPEPDLFKGNGGIGPESSVGAAQAGFDPYSALQNQTPASGFHPDGERAARQVDVPREDFDGRSIPKSTATVLEAQATPDSAVGVIQDAIARGEFSFDTITDEAAQSRARQTVKAKGWDGAREAFHQAAAKGVLSKDLAALGQLLLNNAMNAGDGKAVVDILSDYSSLSTAAAQTMQAQRMLKKMSPEWQLYGAQRSVRNLQGELVKRYKNKAPSLEIPAELAQKFLQAQDQAGRDAAMEEIYRSIADQVPATWMDKWNAWRYLSMLGNPRTHVRNTVGNLGFFPVRMVKDALATAMEAGVDYLSPNGIERTKAALNPASKADRALLRAAFADVANVEEALLGDGKYSESGKGKIDEYRTIFQFKPLEAARRANGTAMNVEDTWFSKPAYAGALAGFLKARGVTGQALTEFLQRSLDEGAQAGYNGGKEADTNGRGEAAGADAGARAGKAETRSEFLERSSSEACESFERGDFAVRFRYPGHSPELRIGTVAETARELKALGIESFIFADGLEVNRNNQTIPVDGDAVTLYHNIVGIRADNPLPPWETAGHEACHMWGKTEQGQDYRDLIRDNVRYGEAFSELAARIEQRYFPDGFDMENLAHQKLFWEEFAADISGKLHDGQDVSGLIQDVEAVTAAWEALKASQKGGKGRSQRGGTKLDAQLLDRARSYAIQEARKATYRDSNAFSEFVGKLRYRGESKIGQASNVILEGVLPFRKTPANILARGLEYSPAGLLKGLTWDLNQVRTGDKTAAQAIDSIAAGLTGTGLLGLGMLLASLGLVSGGGSGDDKQDAQNDLTGGQDYALSIGGQNFTLDWLAPEALPFFVGVELYNTISDRSEGGFQLKDGLSALERITDPMLEMSMLQGVQDAIESVKFADGAVLPTLAANAVVSYLTQGIPTLLGQIERTAEGQRYTTFVDRTSPLPNGMQRALGKVMNKLPGEFQQIPYLDAWGRTEDTGSVGERAFNNFLNPSYTSRENVTAVDAELQRLYDAGQTGVFPSRPGRSCTKIKTQKSLLHKNCGGSLKYNRHG